MYELKSDDMRNSSYVHVHAVHGKDVAFKSEHPFYSKFVTLQWQLKSVFGGFGGSGLLIVLSYVCVAENSTLDSPYRTHELHIRRMKVVNYRNKATQGLG